MTLSVDVLAVLGRHVALAEQVACQEQRAEAHAVFDAIAELIEAAAEVRAAHRELPSMDHPTEVRQEGEARIGRAHYALEAALARVGGAP